MVPSLSRSSGGRRAAVAVLVAAVLGLAACSSGSGPGSGTPSPVSTPPVGTTATTASPSQQVTTRPTSSTPATSRPTTRPTTQSNPSQPTVPPTSSRPTSRPNPSCSIPASLRGVDVEVLPTSRKVVALTFDAGGSDDGVGSILATLGRTGVPGTFFLTGDFVDQFPASARTMARYPVGNHTYDHPDLTSLSDSGIRTEIRSAAARIKAVTGQDPRPLFRFPYGAVDPHVITVVNSECYVPFRWTVDTLGWQGITGGQSVDKVVNRVLAKARPGEIVLMHVGSHPEDHSTLDADALPGVIAGLRARGYGFVTLDSVFP